MHSSTSVHRYKSLYDIAPVYNLGILVFTVFIRMALSPAEIAHGPMLIGTTLNILLYGITISQLYLYHISSNRDGPWIRSLVYLLFVGDTVQTLFTVLYLYDSLIKQFGNIAYLMTGNWGMLGGLVQVFFAWRVKVLTRSIMITIVIFLCAASSFFMGIATAVAISIVPRFVEFQRFKVIVIIWLVCSSFADIVITATLVSYLVFLREQILARCIVLMFDQTKRRTGFSQTDTYIDRVIRLTVQTGFITAIWAFVDLMVYLLNPTGLHLLFNFPLSKLYTNSLMSSLNARSFWQHDNEDDGTLAISSWKTTLKLSTAVAERPVSQHLVLEC
ncbi:hypothetical protein H2248_007476 [Termitomyces sp. 'cryptogamus']|nr:hypothetical protein H2248_007476 [Termitomyces sp. 'cryptogamus']